MKKKALIIAGLFDTKAVAQRTKKCLEYNNYQVDVMLVSENVDSFSEYSWRLIDYLNTNVTPDLIIAQSTGCVPLLYNYRHFSDSKTKIILMAPLSRLKKHKTVRVAHFFLTKMLRLPPSFCVNTSARDNNYLPMRWLSALFDWSDNSRQWYPNVNKIDADFYYPENDDVVDCEDAIDLYGRAFNLNVIRIEDGDHNLMKSGFIVNF